MALKAIPYILQGASLAGGIFGNKRKHIDPNYLREKFGPGAVSKDAIELTNYILNSPYGQQLLGSAAEDGQRFENNVNASAAQAGLGAGGGASSGTGIFATSAGQGAQSGFERAVKGGIYQQAMPIAASMVGGRQDAYLADRASGGVPTEGASLWSRIGNAAGTAAAMVPPGGNAAASAPATGSTMGINVPAQAPALTAAGAQPQLAAAGMGQPSPMMKRLSARRRSMQSIMNGSGAVQRVA